MSAEQSSVPWTRWRRIAASSYGAVAQTFAAKIFLLVANLATGILVARTLAPAGRGELAAMTLWPGLLCSLFTLGVPLALNYNSRRNPGRHAQYVWAAIVLSAGLGIVATLVGIAIIPHMLGKYQLPVVQLAQWLMLMAPFLMMTFVLQAALESRTEFTVSNLSKSLPQLIVLGILGALAVTRHLTPFSSALAYMLPLAIVPIILGWRLRRTIRVAMDRFRDSTRELLSYGVRSYAIDILGTLSQQVDQVLVVGLLSASGLGLYAVALSVSRVLGVFHSSLVTVLFPRAASLAKEDVVALTGRATRISTFVASLGAAALILLLPFLMVRLYGGAFSGVVPVARILSVEVIVTGATSILAQAFLATGRPGTIAE